MPRSTGGDEQDSVQMHRSCSSARSSEVTVMDGVESAAKNAEAHARHLRSAVGVVARDEKQREHQEAERDATEYVRVHALSLAPLA